MDDAELTAWLAGLKDTDLIPRELRDGDDLLAFFVRLADLGLVEPPLPTTIISDGLDEARRRAKDALAQT